MPEWKPPLGVKACWTSAEDPRTEPDVDAAADAPAPAAAGSGDTFGPCSQSRDELSRAAEDGDDRPDLEPLARLGALPLSSLPWAEGGLPVLAAPHPPPPRPPPPPSPRADSADGFSFQKDWGGGGGAADGSGGSLACRGRPIPSREDDVVEGMPPLPPPTPSPPLPPPPLSPMEPPPAAIARGDI